MEENKYVRRFCFAISGEAGKEKCIMTAVHCTETQNGIAALQEGNLSIYTNDYHQFFMLEVASKVNLSEVKSALKKYNQTNGQKLPILNWIGSDDVLPLQRIFKKEPLEAYLVRKAENYKRTVMTLEIKNDPELRAEYIEIHRPKNMWPQVLKNMDTIGIRDMELYLDGYQAFLVMDVDTNFDMEKEGLRWAKLPKEAEWQEFVAKFQKVDPSGKTMEKWKPMRITDILN